MNFPSDSIDGFDEPCGSLVSDRMITTKSKFDMSPIYEMLERHSTVSETIALEQNGQHLVYELGNFRMGDCSCFGLSWFVWESDAKDSRVGWLRLKSTEQVLTAVNGTAALQMSVILGDKDVHDKKAQQWQLVPKTGTQGFQIRSLASPQTYFLAMTPESKLIAQKAAHGKLNTVWMFKEGNFYSKT